MMDLLQLLTALPEKEVREPDPQKMNGVSKKQGLGALEKLLMDQGSGKTASGDPLAPSSIRCNPQVTGITQDSRCVQPGFVFVCISGYQLDGHDYIEDAIHRGAVAVVIEEDRFKGSGCAQTYAQRHKGQVQTFIGTEAESLCPSSVPVLIIVKNGRESLALLSAAFYQHPSRSLRVIGITGTNGKTTTSCLVASILEAAGFSVGLTNTLTCRIKKAESACSEETAAVRTTPESVDLQRTLRQMVDQGCQYAVVEVSSHSLVLNRVLGCEFDVGVLTNITSDHMDFHKTFVEYRQAKMRLFSGLGSGVKQPKAAVLNLDDPSFSVIEENAGCPVFSYGFQAEAQIRADRIIPSRSGIAFEVHIRALPVAATGEGSRSVHAAGADGAEPPVASAFKRLDVLSGSREAARCNGICFAGCRASASTGVLSGSREAARCNGICFAGCRASASTMEIMSTLTGLHNVSNILAAIGVGLAEGIDPAKIQEGIRKVSPVPGRFETIDCGQDFWVVVDFAHTADALQNLLQTARHLGPARIMTVFGCGGDRDQSKRFPMGQVAATLSDRLIITNDNSRSEDPAAIARQIEEGVRSVEGYGQPAPAAMESRPGQEKYKIILDRYQAIQRALSWAEDGDMVLIAGKGHEQYQIIGSQCIPFDDRQVARHILKIKSKK